MNAIHDSNCAPAVSLADVLRIDPHFVNYEGVLTQLHLSGEHGRGLFRICNEDKNLFVALVRARAFGFWKKIEELTPHKIPEIVDSIKEELGLLMLENDNIRILADSAGWFMPCKACVDILFEIEKNGWKYAKEYKHTTFEIAMFWAARIHDKGLTMHEAKTIVEECDILGLYIYLDSEHTSDLDWIIRRGKNIKFSEFSTFLTYQEARVENLLQWSRVNKNSIALRSTYLSANGMYWVLRRVVPRAQITYDLDWVIFETEDPQIYLPRIYHLIMKDYECQTSENSSISPKSTTQTNTELVAGVLARNSTANGLIGTAVSLEDFLPQKSRSQTQPKTPALPKNKSQQDFGQGTAKSSTPRIFSLTGSLSSRWTESCT